MTDLAEDAVENLESPFEQFYEDQSKVNPKRKVGLLLVVFYKFSAFWHRVVFTMSMYFQPSIFFTIGAYVFESRKSGLSAIHVFYNRNPLISKVLKSV